MRESTVAGRRAAVRQRPGAAHYLIDDMVEDHDEVIVQSTIDLAHNLGLTCVAEGVQDAATLERLAVLGCDSAQGSYISPALDGPGVTEWLRQRGPAKQPPAGPKRNNQVTKL